MSEVPGQKRINNDIIKLIQNKHEVTSLGRNEYCVKFRGPKDTAYEGGIWNVRVLLPDNYPFKSPSIGFMNRIYHPNVQEDSGVVCLDVINQTWTPLYDLRNIFETFLPQLLTYPNSIDPLNAEAATLCMFDKINFVKTVKTYIQKYATNTSLKLESSSSSSTNSDTESYSSDVA